MYVRFVFSVHVIYLSGSFHRLCEQWGCFSFFLTIIYLYLSFSISFPSILSLYPRNNNDSLILFFSVWRKTNSSNIMIWSKNLESKQSIMDDHFHFIRFWFDWWYLFYSVLWFFLSLRRGNFSTVRLGVNKSTGEQFAIKIINKRKFWHLSKSREQILREIEILKKVKHPNIISYIDIFDTDQYIYLVLELYISLFIIGLFLLCFLLKSVFRFNWNGDGWLLERRVVNCLIKSLRMVHLQNMKQNIYSSRFLKQSIIFTRMALLIVISKYFDFHWFSLCLSVSLSLSSLFLFHFYSHRLLTFWMDWLNK
jgi:hypothetical protein